MPPGPVPSAPPPRRRSGWRIALLVAVPTLLLVGGLGSCAQWLATGGARSLLQGCSATPSSLVVVPDAMSVAEEHPGEDCDITVYLVADDDQRPLPELVDAVVHRFEGAGWSMVEGSATWHGTRTVDGKEYSVEVRGDVSGSGSVAPAAVGAPYVEVWITRDSWGAITAGPSGSTPTGPTAGAYLGSPRWSAGHVLVPTGGEITGYDARGAEVFRTEPCEGASWVSPYPHPPEPVEVAACGARYVGVDGATGRFLWRSEVVGGERHQLAAGLLLVSDTTGVRVVDVATGREVHRAAVGENMTTADANRVYVGTDTVVIALRRGTWAEEWRAPIPNSWLGATGESLEVRTISQQVMSLDKATGQRRWATAVEPSRLGYSIVAGETDETVVTWTTEKDDQVTVFDKATGAKRWELDVPHGESARVLPGAHAVVVVNSTTGRVQVLDERTGQVVRTVSSTAEDAAVDGDRVAVVEVVGGRSRLRVDG